MLGVNNKLGEPEVKLDPWRLFSLCCAPIGRPDQANRATAGTSASSNGVVYVSGYQSNKAGLRRSGKGFGLGPAYAVRD